MGANNSNLHQAKRAKQDEFYTQLSDIEKELCHYKDEFKNKVVLCNCDDPMESSFVKYFSLKFEDLGLKKLIATYYIDATTRRGRKPYKLEYIGDKNDNHMPDPKEYTIKMIGDGDFRSEECLELLKEADIVVTNPPFSLFREYVAQPVEHKKKFLIIGNMNAITYKDIFSLIKDNKIWLGVHPHSGRFQVPDDYKDNSTYDSETGTVKFGNIVWFTNLDHKNRHEDIKLYKKYNRKDYPKYDNYNAIEVSKVADIPMDYAGVMGVPITFLGKHNPEQFELVGFRKGDDDKDVVINGTPPYFRVFIRNKRLEG